MWKSIEGEVEVQEGAVKVQVGEVEAQPQDRVR